MLLKDKVAVITGGAGPNGLGFATARLMAQHGARVVVLDLARAEPATAAAKLGDGHLGLVADVTDKASCDAAIAAVLKAFGRIDVLVNNAGITQPRKTRGHHRRRLRRDPRRQPARHAADVAGRDPADAAPAGRLDHLHLVGVGAARRRHPRRPALLGGQGRRARPGARDGARARHRRRSASTASPPG